jgi:hypothetical protein
MGIERRELNQKSITIIYAKFLKTLKLFFRQWRFTAASVWPIGAARLPASQSVAKLLHPEIVHCLHLSLEKGNTVKGNTVLLTTWRP